MKLSKYHKLWQNHYQHRLQHNNDNANNAINNNRYYIIPFSALSSYPLPHPPLSPNTSRSKRSRPIILTPAVAIASSSSKSSSNGSLLSNKTTTTANMSSSPSSSTSVSSSVSSSSTTDNGIREEFIAAMGLLKLSSNSPRSPTTTTVEFELEAINNNKTGTAAATTRRPTSKIYKCTWRGCNYNTCNLLEIEQHVRNHLSRQNDEEMMSGDEEFYYTEVDDLDVFGNVVNATAAAAAVAATTPMAQIAAQWSNGGASFTLNQFNQQHYNNNNSSSGPESPLLLSDAASSSSSLMAIDDNSMDSSSNPPSPITNNNFQQQQQIGTLLQITTPSSAFIPVQNNYQQHHFDHDYDFSGPTNGNGRKHNNNQRYYEGISILNGNQTVVPRTRGRHRSSNNNNNNSSNSNNNRTTGYQSSHPINIPTNAIQQQQTPNDLMSSSFNHQASYIGGANGSVGHQFDSVGSSSSGFSSYNSSIGSFSPISPPTRSHSSSFGSSTSSSSNSSNNNNSRYIRMNNKNNHSSTTSLSSSLGSTNTVIFNNNNNNSSNNGTSLLLHRTSPTKRVRGDTKKCRKVYGMDNKDQWCNQCKWKKACTRFTS